MFDGETWNVDEIAANLNSSLFDPVTQVHPKSKKKKKKKGTKLEFETAEKQEIKKKIKSKSDGDGSFTVKSVNNESLSIRTVNGKKRKSKTPKDNVKHDQNKTGMSYTNVKEEIQVKPKKKNKNKVDGKSKSTTVNAAKCSPKRTQTLDENDQKMLEEELVPKRKKAQKANLNKAVSKEVAGSSLPRKRKKEAVLTDPESDNQPPHKVKLLDKNIPKEQNARMSRKERRNKRKKSNSKKNKYKHLAGVTNKTEVPVNISVREFVEQNTENNISVSKCAVVPSSITVDMESTKKKDLFKSGSRHEVSTRKRKDEHKNNVNRKDSTEKQPKRSKKLKKLPDFKDKRKKLSTSVSGFDVDKLKVCLASQETLIKSLNKKLENKTERNKGRQSTPLDTTPSVSKSVDIFDRRVSPKSKKDQSNYEVQDGKEVGKSLKERMSEQLNAARFRYLNEQLYTTTGKEASRLFTDDEDAFQVYHKGYDSQVKKWPVDPLDVIVKQIRSMHRHEKKVIADMGCGSARLAQSLTQNQVHSFDLVALNEHVTACEMSKVPLASSSVDVVVFCLSLMGTNLVDYVLEANRILKLGGLMKVAEIESRFEKVGAFVSSIEKLGFQVTVKDTSKKMFYLFDFKKVKSIKRTDVSIKIELEPCIYKKR